jgi:alpha-tubulin suppressor-like RCC1 family protein
MDADFAATGRTAAFRRLRRALILMGVLGAIAMAFASQAQATPIVLNGANAWGEGKSGQIGNGATGEPDVPVAVSKLSGATGVAAGSNFSLALLENGTVMTWGGDGSGQLGNGKSGIENNSNLPVAVCAVGATSPCASHLEEVTAVSAGDEYALALLRSGRVVSWGENISGQLGNGVKGFTSASDVPVPVCAVGTVGTCPSGPYLEGVTAIAGGGAASLALLKDGTVAAWGQGEAGQLGDGTNANSDVPVKVSNLSEVTAIAAGREHGLAVLQDGKVMAWGANAAGDLGDGTEKGSNVPVHVQVGFGLVGAKAVAAGIEHNLALLKTGKVMAWGGNSSGQLGVGPKPGPEPCGTTPTPCSKAPVEVEGLSEVTAIAADGRHSMALLRNGTVKAWGENRTGELGNGSKGPETCTSIGCSTSPVAVCAPGPEAPCPSGPVLSHVRAIAAGAEHSLAVVGPPPPGPAQYGRCVQVKPKLGAYTDRSCQTLALKKGKPTHRGNFEWVPGPAPTCIKVKAHHGKYSDAKCETRAEKKGKPTGSYEKAPGPGYTSSGAEATLETPGLHSTVKCAASTAVGEVTGANTDAEKIVFSGCESASGKCTSVEGAKAEGQIVTSALDTELIEPVPGTVWTEYANSSHAHAPYVAVFSCAGVGFFRTKGWLSGVTSGNVDAMSSVSQTVFAASGGEQALETEFAPMATFEGATGPDPSTWTTTLKNASASQTEIKT